MIKLDFERYVKLPDLARRLSGVFNQVISMFSDVDSKISEIDNNIEVINKDIETISTDLVDLEVKQDKEKYISCVVTQRTFKTTAGGAPIVASDAQFLTSNTTTQRRLNHITTSIGAEDYFRLVNSGTATASVEILKPGKYKLTATQTARRTGYYDSWLSLGGGHSARSSQGHTVTGATTGGNCVVQNWTTTANILAGSFVALFAYYATNSSNECYGLFWTQGTENAPYNFNDTCSLEIELIEDL